VLKKRSRGAAVLVVLVNAFLGAHGVREVVFWHKQLQNLKTEYRGVG